MGSFGRGRASALRIAALLLIQTVAIGAQPQPPAHNTGVLRIAVVLTDADGTATPIPRVVLLVSDNPATAEPRRIRTGADGTVELTLPAGNYTVESDRPVALGGQAYTWTQMIDVAPGRDAVLTLTATNAEIEAATSTTPGTTGTSRADPIRADWAAIHNKWQKSVVEIWTPTRHAIGFLIDARGLIATNDKAIGDATTVEVQLSASVKVAGRVVANDRLHAVALIRIDPAAVASLPPVPLGCGTAPEPVAYEDRVVTIAAPMLEPKAAIPGNVGRVEYQSFQVDWRLGPGNAGGPVFDCDGRAVGITVAEDERDRDAERSGRAVSYVVPIRNLCGGVMAAAEKQLSGAAPAATPLRTEAGLPPHQPARPADAKAPRTQAPSIASSDFDIALVTPTMMRDGPTVMGPRSDFANWMDYVTNAPQVLLVRATPQFEESLWKTLARGAAQTQGMALPPMKSFSANFLRMRAYCGTTEIAPIHPFIIERPVNEKTMIREGLYVFGITDFGPHCSTVRFDLYSAKSPDKADSRTIDPKLFAQLADAPPQ